MYAGGILGYGHYGNTYIQIDFSPSIWNDHAFIYSYMREPPPKIAIPPTPRMICRTGGGGSVCHRKFFLRKNFLGGVKALGRKGLRHYLTS